MLWLSWPNAIFMDWGVDRDKEAAKLWLQEADRQGDEYAREYLKI